MSVSIKYINITSDDSFRGVTRATVNSCTVNSKITTTFSL